MDETHQQVRNQRLKAYRLMIITFIVCFLLAPFVFWASISKLNSTTLALFVVSYILIFGGLLAFYLYRYKKMQRG
jgi:drug/metabolite transporter (DMT)-like permease